MTAAVLTEFAKLRRSAIWVVVVLLPVTSLIAGVSSTFAVEGTLTDGWNTLWVRTVGFYGMFILPTGIGVLASLVWRAEHHGGNWNALMARPVSPLQVVAGKAVAVAVLAAVMQLVLLTGQLVVGKLMLGLPGLLPVEYLMVSGLIVLASVPVCALQSGLSMQIRSFVAPVAVALAGAALGVVVLLAEIGILTTVLPHALLVRAALLGSPLEGASAFDDIDVAAGSVAPIATASLLLTGLLVVGTAAVLRRSDIR